MQSILLVVVGYLIHDAIQPTVVGTVLDKLALPGDLLVNGELDA